MIRFEDKWMPECPHVWGIFDHLPPMPKPVGISVRVPSRTPGTGKDVERHKVGHAIPKSRVRFGPLRPEDGLKRCAQCWQIKPLADFGSLQTCAACLSKKRALFERLQKGRDAQKEGTS